MRRDCPRRPAPFLLYLLTALALCAPLAAQSGPLERVVLEQLTRRLTNPTSIAHAGDGSGRLFVTEQPGRVRVLRDGRLLDAPFLDLRSETSCCGELGLLGIAFHPRFQTNGSFYVFRTDLDGESVLSRFHADAGADQADPTSEQVLLRIPQPRIEHQAGQLQFGPDGFLYVAVGDGGPSFPPSDAAQQTDNLLGAVLRIDVDAEDASYAVPPTNPFVGRNDARDEIWAYGLRNPWRLSFDRLTGDLWIADVGLENAEEIDFQPAASDGGENYGWNVMEGATCLNGADDCNPDGALVEPVHEYSHEVGCAVIGGYVYRGAELPDLAGAYLYSDFCSGVVYAGRRAPSGWEALGELPTDAAVTSFGEDEAGELYVASHGGELWRLSAARAPSVSFLYPRVAYAGGPPFTLYMIGANFIAGVEARWNGRLLPSRVLDSRTLAVDIAASDVAAGGAVEIAVSQPALPDAEAARVELPVEDPGALAPRIGEGGVVNAAGFVSGPLAPGSIASVFGRDLAIFTRGAPRSPLATLLGGGGVVFADEHWAPIFYASASQMNVQVPWELAGYGETIARARVGGLTGDGVPVEITSHAPSVFVLDAVRPRQGAILIGNSGGVIAAPEAPGLNARPLQDGESLTLYMTGLGPVTNTPPTGAPAGAFPLSRTPTEPLVSVGGVPARILYSGLAPGLVALYQVNARPGPGTPTGEAVELRVSIGEATSPAVILAIE